MSSSSQYSKSYRKRKAKRYKCVFISQCLLCSHMEMSMGFFHSLIDPNVTEVIRGSKKVSTCGWPTFHSNSFICPQGWVPFHNLLFFGGSDCRLRRPCWLSLRPAFRSWPLNWGTAAWNWESWAKGYRMRRNFSRSGIYTYYNYTD